MYVRSQNGETAAQFNMDFVYLEMILGIGTSCPPFITLAATLEALISGDSFLPFLIELNIGVFQLLFF